jgi:hypothetical protein
MHLHPNGNAMASCKVRDFADHVAGEIEEATSAMRRQNFRSPVEALDRRSESL